MNKKIKALIQKLKSKIMWNGLLGLAYADEPMTTQSQAQTQPVVNPVMQQIVNTEVQPTQPTQPNAPQAISNVEVAPNTVVAGNLNIDSLIAKARQEEKNKLYTEINTLKADLETKIKRVNELHAELSKKDTEIATLKSESKKSESAKIKELEVEVEKLKGELALKDNELNQTKLSSYRELKISQAGGNIIPELVTGSTLEEIDASYAKAVERYNSIVSSVAQSIPSNVHSAPGVRDVNVGAVTGYPTVASPNIGANAQIQTTNLEDINLFSPEGRKQYEALRNNLNIR